MTIIGIVVAGALGAVVRFVIGHRANHDLPFGTAAVNVAAAFALGVLVARDAGGVLVQVGFLGALSTWSTLAAEVVELVRADRRPVAAGYLIGSCIIGVAAAWLGLQLA